MDLRYLSGVLLLATVPMALYALEGRPVVALALLNVAIVVASLVAMVGPGEDEDATAVH